jgi:hypothetical protein
MIEQFQWLIDHAGWHEAALLPEDQGVDTRERIAKDGIIFSAYRIPRGGSSFGRVDPDRPPQWAQSTGVGCSITVEELHEQLGLRPDEREYFRALDSRFDDVKSYLSGTEFARTRLVAEIAMLPKKYAAQRTVFRQWRAEIGLWGVIKGLVGSRALERRTLAQFRRALGALPEGGSPKDRSAAASGLRSLP